MANVQLNPGTGGAYVATNGVTRDTVTEEMEIVNIGDPTTAACATVDANGLAVSIKASVLPTGAAQDGTDGSGITQPTGGVGIRGWLSGIYKALIGTLTATITGALPAGTNLLGSVKISDGTHVGAITAYNSIVTSERGCSYLNITDATVHSVTATGLVGFQNLSGSAQTVSITAYDGTTNTSPVMSAPMVLGAGQIITFPGGGIVSTSGSIAFQCSGAPTTGIQALYRV